MRDDSSYDKLLLLDRLEELREDMRDLDIQSLDDLERRIAALEEDLADDEHGGRDDGSL